MLLLWDVQTQVVSEDHIYIFIVKLDNYKVKNCWLNNIILKTTDMEGHITYCLHDPYLYNFTAVFYLSLSLSYGASAHIWVMASPIIFYIY